jgi:hypothetical protein
MKSKTTRESLITKKSVSLLLVALSFVAVAQAPARASPELDKQYALETVGYLRSWDNVDGLFADYVASAYRDWFTTQTRFRMVDLTKADSIIQGSKLPYQKVIEDNDILGQIARALKVESIIRTRVYKEGPQYKFVLEWLHSPKMDQIASDTFKLEEPRDGRAFGLGDVKGALQKSLDRMVAKLPFVANVTGRDNQSVTINLGHGNAAVGKGDTLEIATIDEVKKHPLLHQIVDWRLTHTGTAVVEDTDEGIAFAKITSEDPGRSVARYQKVTQIIPAPQDPRKPDTVYESTEEARARALAEQPKIGWGAAGLWIGGLSRQYSRANGTSGNKGGGTFFGAKAEGQLWFTREYFAELGFGFGTSGYSQNDIATGTPSTADLSGITTTTVRLDVGYTYFTTPDFFGPKAWVKAGYHTIGHGQAALASASVGGMSYKGLFLGVGGELPIRDQFGATLSLDFGLLTSAEESGISSGQVNGSTDVAFFAGGYYRWSNRLTARLGLDITANGADFSNGASVTHRIISVVPSLLYHF